MFLILIPILFNSLNGFVIYSPGSIFTSRQSRVLGTGIGDARRWGGWYEKGFNSCWGIKIRIGLCVKVTLLCKSQVPLTTRESSVIINDTLFSYFSFSIVISFSILNLLKSQLSKVIISGVPVLIKYLYKNLYFSTYMYIHVYIIFV